MKNNNLLNYITDLVENIPSDWLNLTTHRLDIYNEKLAKVQFLQELNILFHNSDSRQEALQKLPTAFDYIRLGHPLSCVLEWLIAELNNTLANNVISFSSKTAPLLAILRKNLLDNKNTQIFYTGSLPANFDADLLRSVYAYKFELIHIDGIGELANVKRESNNTSTILFCQQQEIGGWGHTISENKEIDFFVQTHENLGSIIIVNGSENEKYISEIQHVRRRETIAMTPDDCLRALEVIIAKNKTIESKNAAEDKKKVLKSIQEVTESKINALLGSSGLSIQYAIMMGLVDDANENYPNKAIKFVVPPNCYGGTNDQARRVAACIDNVEIVDLPVDGNSDMVQSTELVLEEIARQDAVPYIIAEIPTNPRVEVPNLVQLELALSKERKTDKGLSAVKPVFILDQTFCPNFHFLGENAILSNVKTISYVSGSKFPSGGLCTAGYCVSNQITASLMPKIEKHLKLCDNIATDLQVEILAKQLPSMNQRIEQAYQNTREFVSYIQEILPKAKLNFVSEKLALDGFTPSVFSLDLPSNGNSEEEKQKKRRALNFKLINLMINEIPNEAKFCVSYGQLKGSYWTIPATSTQGTTREGDKDYIVRVSLAPEMDVKKHKDFFSKFVEGL